MRQWVGEEARFYPHVALHDFEAWLLPYWDKIQRLTGSNHQAPRMHPEKVNHNKPPAFHLAEAFRRGPKTSFYVKARDAGRILKDEDLVVAIDACTELKAFVNTILGLCDASAVIA